MSSWETWNDQWNRVIRYYDRFCTMNNGVAPYGNHSDYYFDDMRAFFQNCYHLKDWLEKDGFISANSQLKPYEYILSNECLKICADFANSMKHMKIDPNRYPPKSGHEPISAGRHLAVTSGSPIVTLKASIEHDHKTIDAFDLATNCMQAWKAYIGNQ